MPRYAAAQFFSGTDVTANLATCRSWISRAAAVGAELVVLPENCNRVRDFADRQTCWNLTERIDGEFVRGLAALAAEFGVWVAAGVDVAADEAPVVHISQLLFDPQGSLAARVNKHVLWDYEYTLFEAGDEPYEVVDTPLGRIGMLLCADGIVPETPRALGLLGAQVLVNSLNSRGPDELRVHIPLRALENRVFHVSANTVGGPSDAWPWMGGSQIITPDGRRLAEASEVDEDLIWADFDPTDADDKSTALVDDAFAWRRPDLYGRMVEALDELPVAAMYGSNSASPRPVPTALLQVSRHHSDEWTLTRVAGQIEWAGRQGARLGVLPELFALEDSGVGDPDAAADASAAALDVVAKAAAAADMVVVGSFVERDGDALYHSAVVVGRSGDVLGSYRKAHLNREERRWATAGSELVVLDTDVGRLGLMIGDEVWIPEVARILALEGAEIICHPTCWDRHEAAHVAATERTEENRVHLVSTTRLDGPTDIGSQIVRANAFQGGEPIALMRYPTGYWTRPGFEEQLVIELDLDESHSKLMGPHLDPLATRAPQLYEAFVKPTR